MHGQPQITQADPIAQHFGLIFGSAEVNPFSPQRTVPCHTLSVAQLALLCMRRRDEPQQIAEVGVWQGQTSRWLLTMLTRATLHMIDPFTAGVPGTTWYDKGDKFGKRPQAQHDAHYDLAQQLARQFVPRAQVHRLPSVEAAALFPDGYLDVVFLDGAHDYDNVMADFKAWLPKVRKGGYLSGHDYHVGGNYFGLVAAVEESVKENGLKLECYPGKVWACKIGGHTNRDYVGSLATISC
jgi:hypothetical protein